MGYTGIIAAIDKSTLNKRYLVVLYNNQSGKWSFGKQLVDERGLINALASKNLKLANATLSKDAKGNIIIKGEPASLERFNPGLLTGSRPVVIISEIRNENEDILGYRIANHEGSVKSIKAAELYNFCRRAINAEDKMSNKNNSFSPIQNAEFVRKTSKRDEHIKPYKKDQFLVEHLYSNKAKTIKPGKVDKAENEKRISKLEEIFSKEQIHQLRLGKEAGVNYKIYGNNKLLPEQMEEIRLALVNGVDPTLFTDPAFAAKTMKAYRIQSKYGVDISKFISPDYDFYQIYEISTAILSGIDITEIANPKIKATEMAKKRIELESKIWTDEDVSVLDLISVDI